MGPHPDGRMLGALSRRPAIELADLAVALRTVLNGEGKITCTIEPTKEGLASYRSFKMPETDGSPKSIAEVRKNWRRLSVCRKSKPLVCPPIPDSHWRSSTPTIS